MTQTKLPAAEALRIQSNVNRAIVCLAGRDPYTCERVELATGYPPVR